MGIADKIRSTAEDIKDKAADTLADAKHKAQTMTADADDGTTKNDTTNNDSAERGVGENGRATADTVDLDAPTDRVSETRNPTVRSDKLQGL